MPSKLQILSIPLVLAAMLFVVSSAHATPVDATAVPLAFEEELGFEEEGEEETEFAEEECKFAQEEAEEGELSKADADEVCKETREAAKEAADSSATGECAIHSASAHSSFQNDRLKLTVGYTTNAPVAATIQIHGVGTFKRHLGRSGVLRFSKKLSGEPHGRPVVRIKLPASEKVGCPARRLVLRAS